MDRKSIWELSVQTTLSALGIWSVSWCRTSEGFTLQIVSYADVLISRFLKFRSYYLFCLCDASCGRKRTNKRVGWSHQPGLKPIRAHLRARGWALFPVSSADGGWNPSDLWAALQKMKSLKEVHKDSASNRTPVTLGWALPPPTRTNGNGGGRGKRVLKTAVTPKRLQKWKRARSHRRREPRERVEMREAERVRAIKGSGLPKHGLDN